MRFRIIFAFFILSFLIIGNQSLASTTNGTIDSTHHYAWGENVGWVDFANVTVTDTALSGSIYGENIGWIDLSTVINTTSSNMGDLSGYAWGENVGWVDFSPSYIGTEGVFYGSIYGENIGWIIFGTGHYVMTDWRPTGWRTSSSGGGGVVSVSSMNVIPAPVTTVVPTICKPGEKFSTTTGLPCTSFVAEPILPISQCLLTITLRQGSKGEQVKCLQILLKNLVQDGSFGPKTKQAVIVFQKNHQLTPDGIVGPLTRAIINSINQN